MDTLQAVYEIESTAEEIAERAQGVAIEQSVEAPLRAIRRPDILEEIVGQVGEIECTGPDLYRVTIHFNVANTGFEPAQFMNVLFGNTSLQADVQLVDIHLPPALLAAFQGPQFGIAGLRARTGAAGRPLTATAIKPMGATPEELGELCRTFALAGLDIIKDDHGLANQAYAPFADRIRACQTAVDAVYAETGHRALYVPNLLGTPEILYREAELVRELGIGAVMLAPMLVGVPVFYEIVAKHVDVPVLAHPALSGALRIAPPLLFGKLYRLFGGDAVIFTSYGGRFSYSRAACRELAENLRRPWGALRPAFPTPAGGMQVEGIGELVDFYGRDVMLLISGGLLAADDVLAQSRRFVENVQALSH